MPTLPTLDWPCRGRPVVQTPEGWEHAHADALLSPEADTPLPAAGLLVFLGCRLASLRCAARSCRGLVEMAYFDVPRLKTFKAARPSAALPVWLSLIEAHVRAILPLLNPEGRLVVHIDDEGAAWTRAVAAGVQGLHYDDTILWQKKYSPQNDLEGRIDDGHDFLYVFRPGEACGSLETTWWGHRHAGKAEDATKGLEQLRKAGTIATAIPRTSKPLKLIGRLLDAYTRPGGVVLEVYSDTGFASFAALTHEPPRRAILLVGAAPDERSRFDAIARPWLATTDQPCAVVEVPDLFRAHVPTGGLVRYGTPLPDRDGDEPLRPLLADEGEGTSYRVVGEVGAALEAARPVLRQLARVGYLDLSAAPAAEWGERLPALLGGLAGLLPPEGLVVLEVAEEGYAPARLIAERLFGQSQYAGSIVTPRGRSHAAFLLFRPLYDDRLSRLGLLAQRDYSNPDADPRGEWRDTGYKDARSGGPSTSRPYQVPPYHWQLIDRGSLPAEFRLHPATGVLWAHRCAWSGDFEFQVRVTDSAGAASEATCRVSVRSDTTTPLPKTVWWLDCQNLHPDDDAPRVVTTSLSQGKIDERYGFALVAHGGKPFDRTLRPGKDNGAGGRTRFWAFGPATIAEKVLDNRVFFGKKHLSNPSWKVFAHEEKASVQVELSWWDAERLGGDTPRTRLVEMLTAPNDLVVEVGDGELASAALELGRRAVVFGGEGPYRVWRLGEPIAVRERDDVAFQFNHAAPRFDEGMLWLEGFLPADVGLGPPVARCGVTLDGEEAGVLLAPDAWITASLVRAIEERLLPRFRRVIVYHSLGWPPADRVPGLVYRRVPFALSCTRLVPHVAPEAE